MNELMRLATDEVKSLDRRYRRALRALAEVHAANQDLFRPRERIENALRAFEMDLVTPDLDRFRQLCREAEVGAESSDAP